MIKLIKEYLLAIFTLVLLLGANSSFAQDNTAIAFCCAGETARCTGSSYCTACTNCSRCRHCNSGGSCGICSGKSRRTNTPTSNNYNYPSSSSSSTSTSYGTNKLNSKSQGSTNSFLSSEIYSLPNNIYSEYYLKTLMVNTLTLNLRKGPGTNYGILESLRQYQEIVFLAMKDDWVKVRVKSTNTIGFVHYKYVVVLTD